MRFSGPRPGPKAKKSIGLFTAVVFNKVEKVISAMKEQAEANLKEQFDYLVEKELREILTEGLQTLVSLMELSETESDLSFKVDKGRTYTYAKLQPETVNKKSRVYSYTPKKMPFPYKNKFYKINKKQSVVGALDALSNQADFGQKYLNLLGVRKESIESGSANYTPPDEHYRRMAERKRAELARSSRVL